MNEIEKAINILNDIISDTKDVAGTEEYCEAVKLSREALVKQIPKKAEYHHNASGECALTICPNCKNRLTVARYIFPLDRYCKECGQRYVIDIKDWSVEE